MENISKLTPILYAKNETNFNHNGLGKLTTLLIYEIDEVLNGEFEAFFEYPVNGQLAEKIDNEMFIKAKPNKKDEAHIFKVYDYELDTFTQTYLIYARSKNIEDLRNNVILDVNVRNLAPTQAWNLAKNNALDPVVTTFYSDIATTSSVHWERRSLLSTIAGEEGSMIQYWGGEIKHDINRISLLRRRGQDNVTTVRHGKNLDGLKATYSTKGLVTAIVPYYIKNDDKAVYGEVVESQYIKKYPSTYYDIIEYNDEELGLKREDEPENGYSDSTIKTALNKVAKRYFDENIGKDLPSVNMEIALEDISQTKEYEQFKDFEQIEIGDTITVYSKKFSVNINAKVRRVAYNGLTDKNELVEVGTARRSLYDDVRDDFKKIETELQEGVDNALVSANGKNTNYYGTADPNEMGLVGQNNDNYFRTNGQLKELWIYRDGQWHLEVGDLTGEQIRAEVEQAQRDLVDVKETADEANQEINDAVANAGFTTLDETIRSVESRASTAFDTANDLIGEVSGYSQTVDGFNQTVNNYENQVANFRLNVDGFSSTVASYSSEVGGYATQVSTLTNTVDGFNSTVANIDGRVTSLSTTVDGVNSTVQGLDGRISTVEQTASGLQTTVAGKANQSQLTQLETGFKLFAGSVNTVNKNLADKWVSQKINNDGTATATNTSRATVCIKLSDNTTHLTVEDGSWGGWYNSAFFWYKENSDSGYLGKYDLRINEDPGENVVTVEIPPNAKYFRYHTTPNMSRETKIEVGTEATGLFYNDSEIRSEISIVQDNINLRVQKGDIVNQINISDESILIDAGRVHIGSSTIIDDGIITNRMVASNISADKMTTGTLNAANVRIINLDFDTAVGNRTEFVQSAWNDVAGGSVVVTGAGITTTNSDGSKLTMSQGRFWVQNTAGSNLGQFGYIDDPDAPLTHYVRIRTSLGTNFAISQVYGYDDTFKDTLHLSVNSSGQATMSMQARILMNYEGIYFSDRTDQEQGSIRRVGSALRVIGPQGGSSSSVAIYGGIGGSSIKVGYTLETYSDGAISNHMWATLNMNSSSITNQSDARLKKEIVKDEIDSLEAIKQWEISGYYWKDNEYSSERQFGIIAQSAPEIAYEGRDGYLNVNSTKQLQMTTHGLQQLEVREENTNKVASQALQATETNAQKIKRLEKRVEELESVA